MREPEVGNQKRGSVLAIICSKARKTVFPFASRLIASNSTSVIISSPSFAPSDGDLQSVSEKRASCSPFRRKARLEDASAISLRIELIICSSCAWESFMARTATSGE